MLISDTCTSTACCIEVLPWDVQQYNSTLSAGARATGAGRWHGLFAAGAGHWCGTFDSEHVNHPWPARPCDVPLHYRHQELQVMGDDVVIDADIPGPGIYGNPNVPGAGLGG